MSKPSKETIRHELKRLRDFIDNSDDEIAKRVAYESEQTIRWVTESTVDWPLPVESAMGTSELIRIEFAETVRKALSP